jgi:hypothetical protein
MTRQGQARALALLTLVDAAGVAASLLSATRVSECEGCGRDPLAMAAVAALTFCAAVAAVVPAVGWIVWARGEKVAWLVQLVPLLLTVGGQGVLIARVAAS